MVRSSFEFPKAFIEARAQSIKTPQTSPIKMTNSSPSEIEQFVDYGEHDGENTTKDTIPSRSSTPFYAIYPLNTPITADKIGDFSSLTESLRTVSGLSGKAMSAGRTTCTNSPTSSIHGSATPSWKKKSRKSKGRSKEKNDNKDRANDLPSYLSEELLEDKKNEIRAAVKAARYKWFTEHMPNHPDVKTLQDPEQDEESELSDEQSNGSHVTTGAVHRFFKTTMSDYSYFKKLLEAGYGEVDETRDTESGDEDTKDITATDKDDEAKIAQAVREKPFVDSKKDAAVAMADKMEPTYSNTGSESFIHRSGDWHVPGPNNPFSSLVTRPRIFVDSRYRNSPRYWVHDKVQDELRHDFRTKVDGKTATDIVMTYFESISKETTSKVDCEKIVDKGDGKVPEVTADQWRVIYATMFMERCEKNRW
jgi:hypothetical protein